MNYSSNANIAQEPVLAPDQTGLRNEIIINALFHQYILQVQGGRLYPEHIPLNTMSRVLDLGCGAGEWLFDLARRHPKLHIYGIDINKEALKQAKIRRNTSGLRQVELRQMDLLEPLPVPSQYLDFVHMRRCAHVISPSLWPRIIGECMRILRPGGWLTLVEAELCEISSPACMCIYRAVLQACSKLGRTMDSSGTTFGIASRLYALLLQAALDEISYDVHVIDLGFMSGNIGRLLLTEFMRHVFLIKPLVIQQGIIDVAEFDALLEQARAELLAPDFCGWAILISAYGRCGTR